METSLGTTSNKALKGVPAAADRSTREAKRKRKPRHNNQYKPRLRCLEDMDQRTLAAQRARQLVRDMESDLGGAAALTAGKREMLKHAALLSALAEHYETQWLQREPNVDIHAYLGVVKTQKQLLLALGLDRIARTVVDPNMQLLEQELRRLDAEGDSA
jgi:hypothetical protein